MHVRIRTKVVLLLLFAAALPLTVSLLILVFGGSRVQVRSFGEMTASLASSEARLLETRLVKDIEKIELALHEPEVLAALAEPPRKLSALEISELDAHWAQLSVTSEPMQRVLNHPLAEILRLIRYSDPRIAEGLITDRHGQLVASTGRTGDFYQADETWWKRAWNDGRGRVVVPPINYDRSAGVWSVDICVPIGRRGEVLGVAKVVLEVSQWIGGLVRPVGDQAAEVLLLRSRTGRIVYGRGPEPLSKVLPDWSEHLLGGPRRWRVDRKQIQAWSALSFPQRIGRYRTRIPHWTLMLHMPESDALAGVYRISGLVLGIGVVLIGGIFLAVLALTDATLVRRVRRLADASGHIAAGDLDYRVRAQRRFRPLGPDELDELTEGFNAMVDRLQESMEDLTEANELKTNFIHIAGHELRTPVSYILAMLKLLESTDNPQRVRRGVESIRSRTRRLEQIVENMFKVLPSEEYATDRRLPPVDLRELMEEVYLDTQPFLEERNERMTIEAPDDLPPVPGDREKLRDVIENLVANAIAFSPEGGAVSVELKHELGDWVSIRVTNRGPQISEEQLPHIFEPLYTGGEVMQHGTAGTTATGTGGIGLGLAVAKRFVEYHRGRIEVDTRPEQTIFTVLLPRKQPEQEEE